MADDPDDDVLLADEIASCVRSELDLVSFVEQVTGVDAAAPSRLPGWTIGHVMTHIARNADGALSMLAGRPQYPHGRTGRNADIEAGAIRSWSELADDVISRSRQVIAGIESCDDWAGTVEMITGERPKAHIPLLRQREVEVHRVDLGLGHEFVDMPADYVRRDLRLMGMLWTARQPMGLTPLPEAALRLPPATRLAWMMGRVEVDGLAPADLF